MVAALTALSAFAHAGQAQFAVSVTVPTRVALDVIEQPAVLVITADDVARGYKDVSARYVVRHNDRRGCALRIATNDRDAASIVQAIEIRGLGDDVVLRDGAANLHVPGDAFRFDVALELRFVLAASTHPGTFDLPVEIGAAPI
jgi:hypothetical protein